MSESIQSSIPVQQVQFRLVDIQKTDFIQNDYLSLGYSREDILKGDIALNVRFELNPDDELFSVIIKMDYLKEGHLLFGIETRHQYYVKNFRIALKFEDSGQFQVTDDLMKLWLQVAINDTRGMLVILNSQHDYSRIILPLIDLSDLLKTIKKGIYRNL